MLVEQNTILIIEDEPEIVKIITKYLKKEGFASKAFYEGNAALTELKSIDPICVLLDLSLPDCDGLDVLERIKAVSDIPIVMVTGRTDEDDVCKGLNKGADDYISKPFRIREVVARLKAVLRRSFRPKNSTKKIVIDPFVLEIESKGLWKKGKKIPLTPTEFKLLKVLMENAGKIFYLETKSLNLSTVICMKA